MEVGRERHLTRVRAWRWPGGVRCPYCAAARWTLHARERGEGRGRGRPKYRCGSCLRIFNDLTSTPFAHSRLPLEKWFECAQHLRHGRATCADLARRLKVKVSTAWRMRAVLRRSFTTEEFDRLFGEEA